MSLKAVLANRLLLVAVVGCVGLAAAWLASRDTIAQEPAGGAGACQSIPAFVKSFGLTQPYFDTSRRDRPGLVLADTAQPETVIQKPNWRQFGSLGPLANGERGVTYSASVPVVNTLSTDEQNHLSILRLDPDSGDLELWTRLAGDPPGAGNYYGVVALTYDCASKLLYASAVAGSTINEQRGFVAAIDTTTGEERFRYEGLDALGLGIYGGSNGRYLYAGLARSSDIVRLRLTDEGKPFGEAQPVLRFDDLNRTRARKLDFQAGKLIIDTTEFYYNLVASTEFEQRRLTYRYDGRSDSFSRQ